MQGRCLLPPSYPHLAPSKTKLPTCPIRATRSFFRTSIFLTYSLLDDTCFQDHQLLNEGRVVYKSKCYPIRVDQIGTSCHTLLVTRYLSRHACYTVMGTRVTLDPCQDFYFLTFYTGSTGTSFSTVVGCCTFTIKCLSLRVSPFVLWQMLVL